MRLIIRIIMIAIALLVLCFGVLFAVQNNVEVPLDLLVFQLSEQRVALWVLLAFALGGVMGIVVSSVAIIKLRGDLLVLRRKQDRSSKEIDKLRTAGIKG